KRIDYRVIGIWLQIIRDGKQRHPMLEHILSKIDKARCVIEHSQLVLQNREHEKCQYKNK
ncbi:hypothetical protein NE662_09615, partial [Bifidobacterium pseudocatenulatum]|nr:hypothetical protein [Bifidobacterium pseudocatenulatum]